MRSPIAGLALAALLAAAAAAGAEVRGGCDVTFLGTSTLHDFSGTAECRPFSAPLVRQTSGRMVIPAAEVEVDVPGMNTANAKRDRQMREMFQSALFPRIRGVLREVDPERIRRETRTGGAGTAPLDLNLRIRDVERPVRATLSRLKEDGGKISFDLNFPVSLNDYGLKPPRLLGFLRVGDRVTVTAHVRIEMPPAE